MLRIIAELRGWTKKRGKYTETFWCLYLTAHWMFNRVARKSILPRLEAL